MIAAASSAGPVIIDMVKIGGQKSRSSSPTSVEPFDGSLGTRYRSSLEASPCQEHNRKGVTVLTMANDPLRFVPFKGHQPSKTERVPVFTVILIYASATIGGGIVCPLMFLYSLMNSNDPGDSSPMGVPLAMGISAIIGAIVGFLFALAFHIFILLNSLMNIFMNPRKQTHMDDWH
ncbi:hypothetical protein ACYOEI_16010 [Singulisphaera rosea]